MEYIVVSCPHYLSALETKVNDAIAKGFRPVGGIAVHEQNLLQAMVRQQIPLPGNGRFAALSFAEAAEAAIREHGPMTTRTIARVLGENGKPVVKLENLSAALSRSKTLHNVDGTWRIVENSH